MHNSMTIRYLSGNNNGVQTMRYEISYNVPSRLLMSPLGVGPGKSWVDVDDTSVRAKMGWSGTVTIPRANIASVERVASVPWWLGYGLHGGFRGTWALNGSNRGAVKLTLNEPASGKVMGIPIHARTVYFSLEEPDEFVSSLRPKSAQVQAGAPYDHTVGW